MFTYLLIVFRNIFDILKIYLKLAILTVGFYLVAEWYIVRYGIDLNDNEASLVPAKPTDNSTVYKVYTLMLDFFFR